MAAECSDAGEGCEGAGHSAAGIPTAAADGGSTDVHLQLPQSASQNEYLIKVDEQIAGQTLGCWK